MILPDREPDGYGPLGTPNNGRAERIAADERRNLRAALEAREQQERVQLRNELGYGPADLFSMRQAVRSLRDHLGDLSRQQEQLHQAVNHLRKEMNSFREDVIGSIGYLADSTEVSRNGQAASGR